MYLTSFEMNRRVFRMTVLRANVAATTDVIVKRGGSEGGVRQIMQD